MNKDVILLKYCRVLLSPLEQNNQLHNLIVRTSNIPAIGMTSSLRPYTSSSRDATSSDVMTMGGVTSHDNDVSDEVVDEEEWRSIDETRAQLGQLFVCDVI